RMNETLEAMARAIFKDWFVDFGPTRAKAEGRASYLAPELWDLFPDALDDEGKPVGWITRSLEDFLKLAYGKSLPAKTRIPGKVAVYGSGGLTGTHDTALIDGPAVVVGRKGTVGSLYWEDGPVFPIDTVFYVIPRIGSVLFSYHLLSTQPLRDMNTDAAVPGLNRGNAYRLEFPQPTSGLISAFEEIASALWQRRAGNLKEVETLSQTRDLLLPKLLSGEICLCDPERAQEAVA
ncbi:MAG: restriction endonuclease subunit S, partial [Gammaproteobacteria bacterium]|nr:restriction endonuclease subunit S [Gammaproteobacteria bacterium]